MINFLLLAVALLLSIPSFLIGPLFTIGYSIRFRVWRPMLTYYAQSALSIALVLDLLGNVVSKDFLNWACLKGPDRHLFGTYTETISSVLGKNKATGSLTRAGHWLADLLNFIDPGHVERAAGITTPRTIMQLNQVFLSEIQHVLATHDLRYDDGSTENSDDARITAVRLPWHRSFRWKAEKKGEAQRRLAQYVLNAAPAVGPQRLANLFLFRRGVRAYLRNTNGDAKVDLYIVASFGWWYVGIKTTLIYT